MTRAIIFANGVLDIAPGILKDLISSDLVIAADGGSQHCKSLGITPGVIIGDLDSLDSDDIENYHSAGVKVIQYPTHKDETDLELALGLATQRNVDEAYIIGALGARWDMTIANILLLAQPKFKKMKLHLLDGSQEMIVIQGKTRIDIAGQPGDPLSLIPLAGDAHGVSLQGLEYPLKNETLYFGSSRGVSNAFLKSHAQIEVREGSLLCIFNWVGNIRGD